MKKGDLFELHLGAPMEREKLIALRDALESARYQGVLTVRHNEKWITYKSDKEMASALSALNKKIAVLEGRRPPRVVLTYARKGL